jgi:uncharacterized radical SAM protein YgiQ
MAQKHGDRWRAHNPPPEPLPPPELDRVYSLPYERRVHPSCLARGDVAAIETVRFSITTHRGCFGGCSFCAIALHQGKAVVSRSESSIVAEAAAMALHPDFKGIISDLGGPTANMYGMRCGRKDGGAACSSDGCLHSSPCPSLQASHKDQIALLKKVAAVTGVKRVFVSSGLRHDLVLHDQQWGARYLEELVKNHTSGQLKVAPEHSVSGVLALMKKPGAKTLIKFKKLFDTLTRRHGKKQFLTYYFIAAHPGCSQRDMEALDAFIANHLKLKPQQVQIFTPTPSTHSTLMYWTGIDPWSGATIFVEKTAAGKSRQKKCIVRSDAPQAAATRKIAGGRKKQ